MPNAPKNKHRSIAGFSDEEWFYLGWLAERRGTTRSALLRQFAFWWCRYPGARLPERPTTAELNEARKAWEAARLAA